MKVLYLLTFLAIYLSCPANAYAADTPDLTSFTNQTLNTLIIIASLASTFFLVKGGYTYITSTGNPDALQSAKNTIRNALIGLVLVISATLITSILNHAFTTPNSPSQTAPLELQPIKPEEPPGGLTRLIVDAVNGFLQNIVLSATKPLVDGIMSFLTTTPSVLKNSVVFNFWLVMVGIVDSLFALLIAVLGLQFMSASTFGFEEIEFRHILPKIALAFLGANSSIFLVEWLNVSSNVLVETLLKTTGGLEKAWALDTVNLLRIVSGDAAAITLIFMLIFVILAAVLLLFYIMRLIVISLGAVLSPFIFLLWVLPKFSDFAEISVKTYITTVYTVFVHVVIIQLASSFLTIPGQVGSNSLISVLVAIGLLLTLLKTPSFMMQLMFYNTGRGMMRKISYQIMNVLTARKQEAGMSESTGGKGVKTPRKVVKA